ncbi:hypothetical protein FOXB_16898 [Fusarium oxysporum f. sp. conglutinans Fo5176]|uniref:Uncharacterized protein n=1 Tax=Fusarium oxysporum (strain Fo5176) TaxID=660025 RepID=F9GE14_FUSOF|nr:hypothetical protein FOXB_16898 [Fusarium oxysporum f. sp. conglutinans Fo5176]
MAKDTSIVCNSQTVPEKTTIRLHLMENRIVKSLEILFSPDADDISDYENCFMSSTTRVIDTVLEMTELFAVFAKMDNLLRAKPVNWRSRQWIKRSDSKTV